MIHRMLGRLILLACLLCPAAAGLLLNANAADEPLLDQAKRAFQRGDRDEAVRIATRMVEGNPKDPNNYFLRGRFYELMGQREAALEDYNRLLTVAPQATEVHYHRAIIHFLLGHISESAADFDRFVEAQPDKIPALWQRGIALYYAGRYADGRKQFESHQTVNAADVENSVWHFLCVAREKNLSEARKAILPVTGDTRVPMAQILDLFAGTGTPEKVLQAVELAPASSLRQQSRELYAHLYLALYYEVAGNDALRRAHLRKAVDLNLKNEFMWEVARVHWELLQSGRLKQP